MVSKNDNIRVTKKQKIMGTKKIKQYILPNKRIKKIINQYQVDVMNIKDKKNNAQKSHQNKIIEKILGSDGDEHFKGTTHFSFQVCVEIGDGRKGVILISQLSDPLICALEFCHQYNLDEVIAGVLCQSIRQKIQNEKKVYNTAKELNGSENNKSNIAINKQNLVEKNNNEKKQVREKSRVTKSNHSALQSSKNSYANSTQKTKQITEYTYKPKLNEISKIITQKLGRRSILEEIDMNKKKKEEKIQKIKQQLNNKQIQQCSFKPKINLISSRVDQQIINREEIPSQKRYQYLYLLNQKNKSRNGSKEKLTFQPEINNMSKSIVLGMSFQQRQQKFKQKKYEATTPIPNQRPKTGREPKSRNKDKLPIGEYLYNEGKKKSIELLSEHQSEIKSVMLQKSSDIIKQKLQKRLRQIFEMFDKNEDGVLFYQEIDSNVIDTEIFNIFKPIFQEMNVLNIQLNCTQFIEAGIRLISTLNPNQRNIILNTKKKNESTEQYPFKPQINNTIMSKRCQPTVDLYKRSLAQKQRQNQRIQKSKEDRVRKQINQCTFKPKIKKYKNLVYTTNII